MGHELYEVTGPHTLDALALELRARGARPTLLFPPSHVLAEARDGTLPERGTLFAPPDPDVLDVQGRLAVLAHRRMGVEPPPSPVASWDAPGRDAPRELIAAVPPSRPRTAAVGAHGPVPTPTARALVGRVAVAVVLVGRSRGRATLPHPEHLSTTARDLAATQVAAGLGWLAGVEPRAKVEFVIERYDVELQNAADPAAPDTYEDLEAVWRDPALARLGYAPGREGYARLGRDVRDRNHAQWGFVLFVTAYPVHHFAYACAERMVVHHLNDGWGPAELHKVVAHETCHIFGALDEYAGSGCTCDARGGALQVPNANCRVGADPFVPCIMESNTLAMCPSTRGQLGWKAPLLRWNVTSHAVSAVTADARAAMFFADWDGDGVPDLFVVRPSGGATGRTEVQIFSGSSGWRAPILQVGTALHEVDEGVAFCLVDWNGDGAIDLAAVVMEGSATGRAELHVLSGASQFQRIAVHAVTPLKVTGGTWRFGVARFGPGTTAPPDLIAVQTRETGSGRIEARVLSGASGFTREVLRVATPLPDDEGIDVCVAPFADAAFPDLIALKRAGCATRSAEIQVLTGRSRFQTLSEDSGTCLPELDADVSFAAVIRDRTRAVPGLGVLRRARTASGCVEVTLLDP